jgi:hypothetical protein
MAGTVCQMITNRILNVILCVSAIVVIPCQFVTTLVLGLAVSLTFGLLLLPISLVWGLLLFPMVGLSWFCSKVPALRDVLGIIFIPWVVVANTFVALMPSMGELENRARKLMFCESWPFTWEFWQFSSQKLDLESDDPVAVVLKEVVKRNSRGDSIKQSVLIHLAIGQQLDSNI